MTFPGAGSELFSIDNMGIITLSETLTATDEGSYHITVNASDGIHTAEATVNITVYGKEPYDIYYTVHPLLATVFFQLSAGTIQQQRVYSVVIVGLTYIVTLS